MTKRNDDLRLKAVAAAVAGLAMLGGAAHAAPDKAPATPCFYITQWEGWKSPSPDVIYLGVNLHDVYKAELSAGSSQLQWPDVHLISEVRGSNSICTALDLQLSVADRTGFREPLIVKKLTKLTPDEIAAIPKKYRPN